MENQFLTSKNALIFGAKGALGRQVAEVFKKNGAQVFLSDIKVEGKGRTFGPGRNTAVRCLK